MSALEQIRSPSEITSITGRVWQMRTVDERQVMAIMQAASVPEMVARLLAVRGIAVQDAVGFLNPTLRETLPDPFHLKDMRKGAERIAQAVMDREQIAVFGDYDVDGATSSALLRHYFRALGLEPLIYIPDRMTEGYGPNGAAMQILKTQGAKIVITVDCGTLAFEPLKVAKELGLEVIVVDHHKGEPQLPDAYAVVNPNRFDEDSAHGQMAAVGVTFLVCVAVNKILRERSQPVPDLLQWLDLVALGTVCDVVPLVGVNRTLVAQGLKIMASRSNPGLGALMDVAKLSEKPGIYHAGFVIGPRINAGGRVGKSDLGVRLLTSNDTNEIAELARTLDQLNAERKTIEAMALEQALVQAEAQPEEDAVLIVQGEGWHAGVIGIVAARLKERFNKPTAVIALKDGIGKASARSVSGIDIGNAVISALGAGLLTAGGGHAMAAGFTLPEENIQKLREFFNQTLAAQMKARGKGRALLIDAPLTIPALNADLARLIEQVGPYGAGHPAPHFLLSDVQVLKAELVGEHHVRVILGDGSARLVGKSASIKAMAFRCADTVLGQSLLNHKGRKLHVVGAVKLNLWNGRENADFIIEEIAWA